MKRKRANSRRPVHEAVFGKPTRFPITVFWNAGPPTGLHVLKEHDEIEIQYIRRGSGAYAIGRRIYPFRRHTLFVIQPNVPHRFQPEPDVVLDKVYLAFLPAFLREGWTRAILRPVTERVMPGIGD